MHHPSSVDLVVVQNLIRRRNMTLVKFLRSCFSSINKGKAEDVVRGLGKRFDEDEMIQDMVGRLAGDRPPCPAPSEVCEANPDAVAVLVF